MVTKQKFDFSKCFIIPQRYVLGLMGFLAVVNAYLMRVVLSVAITEMVVPIAKVNHSDSEDTCPDPDLLSNSSKSGHVYGVQYEWNESTQGLILSSFYWGYVLTHLPGGILAEKFGGKYALGLGILSTAVLTLLTPMVTKIGDWHWLVVLRVCIGFGEGTTFPALNALLAKWVPISERSTIGTFVYAGAQMGNVIGNAASGLIIAHTESWESVFYVFGVVGIIWFILWVVLCYSDPNEHPFISEKERSFLNKELGNVSHQNKIPWRAILTSKPLWALVVAQLGHDWGLFTMVSDLPKYMKSVLKFNVKQSGIWSSLPYLVMWIISITSGVFCDWLIAKNYIKVTFARKLFTTVASIGPGIFILAASYAGCNQTLTVVFFTVAMGFMGTFYCGMKVNALDLSTNYAGTLMAIVNGLGAFSGIVTPYLAGALTENQTLSEWRLVFWITLGVFIVTSVIFVAFGSGKEQWWNNFDFSEQENNKSNCDLNNTSSTKQNNTS